MIKQIATILILGFPNFTCLAQQNFEKVDAWLHNNLHEIGGRGVIMVWREGKVVYSNAQNELNTREKMSMKWVAKKQGKEVNEALQDFNTLTQMPIASCSKWLSAALVMTFVQEGKLSLVDTLGKYLPIMTKNGNGAIQIKDCLSHLTGIKAPLLKEAITNQQEFKSMDDAVENISKMDMEGEPGKTFHYSNVGLQLVGAIIEKISGQSFESLFQQRIAKPCSMQHTTFGNKPVVMPAGGAVGNAEDYLRFLSMILNDGKFNENQILTKQSIEAMQHNYAHYVKVVYKPEEADLWGYGFGEWTMEEGVENVHSVSSPGLFGTFPWVDKDKKYAAIMLSYNFNFKGRHLRYLGLKKLVDESISTLNSIQKY